MTSQPAVAPATRTDRGVSRTILVFAWLSLVFETTIIATGGAVRLTGSGLGCPTWPMCTADSLVPTAALVDDGIHSLIEFGNRMMTGVVGVVAIAVLLLVLHAVGGRSLLLRAVWYAVAGVAAAVAVYAVASLLGAPAPFVLASAALLLVTIAAAANVTRMAPARRDLVLLSAIVLVGVVAQGFVGGITVLTGLHPWIVGFHYFSSLLLVCVCTAFLVRAYDTPGPRTRVVPTWFAVGMHVTGLALVVTIVFGVLTTGSGPHSGDENVVRDGFDATVLAHVHSWPGYALAVLLVALTALAWVRRLAPRRWLTAMTVVVAVQIAVGVWQARDGLPPLLVGIHMVLAALSAAAYTVAVLRLKAPAAS